MKPASGAVAVAILAAGCAGHGALTAPTSLTTRPVTAAERPDVASAERTAVELTELSARLVGLPEDAALRLERSVASARGASALAAKLRADLSDLDAVADRSTMSYWVAPLAVRTATFTADTATVEVWYVGALQVGTTRTAQEWRTVTYRLVWEDAAWRDDAETAVAGPLPQPLPGVSASDAVDLAARLEGFHSWAVAA